MKGREYSPFYLQVLKHLIVYKKTKMHISDSGHFIEKKGNDEVIDHGKREWILPDSERYRNYMCDEAVKISSEIKLHDFWYNLNSSQTLCVNYFAPLLTHNYKGLNLLLSLLLKKDIQIAYHAFEYVETKGSTNFDFYCIDNEGHKYYFEIKYTEKDVAKSTGSTQPLVVFNKLYRPLILKGSYLKKCLKDSNWEEFMFTHYQAYRNIVMANEELGNYTFFFTMKDNEGTNEELLSAFKDSGDDLKNVKWIYWDDLIPMSIQWLGDDEYLKEYYTELKDKYLLTKDELLSLLKKTKKKDR